MLEVISIKNVTKSDLTGSPILVNITGNIYEGELITIIGPSGSGKSTLLSLLNRMQGFEAGEIRYNGTLYQNLDVLNLRRTVGMVFQIPTMIEGTVEKNIRLGQSLQNEHISDEAIHQLLLMVGLPLHMKDKEAKLLSVGQKQKVALARVLANQPELLLLDEVTASLDSESTAEIEHLIKDIHSRMKKTILWVTHNLEQAKRLGQITWVVDEGRLVEKGKTLEVFNNPKHETTKRLLGLI